ncbi:MULTISPECIES: GspE/PulE family protein [Rhodomicrobium]|uniref:GspE/PulE family protein n=1 Tax=Rhodomicrobium TaxID=1068 RepID=UPI000B4BBAB2|nr:MULTISPECIES: GspE/PulE family protein [Rhodomicrobium]
MSQSEVAAPKNTADPRNAGFVERFGAYLVERDVLAELAVRRAVRAQEQSGERFDLVLTRLGLIPEADMARILADYLGLPLKSAADLPLVALFPGELEAGFLAAAKMIPIDDDGERVTLAMADPFNAEAVSALAFLLGRGIDAAVMSQAEVALGIARLYGGAGAPQAKADYRAETGDEGGEEDVRRLEDLASEAPIIRLVHDLIARAAEMQASDIHLEPRDDGLRARLRLDGVLHTVETYPVSAKAAVTSRIKIMAQLNIAERRVPQDGRIKATVRGREIDLRVSTMPTMNGESVVMRLLDRASVNLDFAALGFAAPIRDALVEVLAEPNGIILVTGPTGSGKTTTLYTALSLLNSSERKTFTVEDPIEYQLDGVNQIQVQPKIALTFASILRSVLRQDPDTIMVGEIRDLETARVAVQASLTGHLVLSTVHTNSAAATITRLLDMGVESYLLASTLKAVLAQRLVRRLCDQCAAPAEPSPVLIDSIGRAGLAKTASTPRHPVGCPACRQTGFRGRTTVAELLLMSTGVQDRLLADGSERAIQEAASADGMPGMFSDGVAKVLAGETTLDEVLRVTRMAS